MSGGLGLEHRSRQRSRPRRSAIPVSAAASPVTGAGDEMSESAAVERVGRVVTPGRHRAGCGAVLRGRDVELEAIGEALAATARGHAGVLFVEGPAGIGKSSLLAEARETARRVGVRALWGEALQSRQMVPFAPRGGRQRADAHRGPPPVNRSSTKRGRSLNLPSLKRPTAPGWPPTNVANRTAPVVA
jgi:hypothetical protein